MTVNRPYFESEKIILGLMLPSRPVLEGSRFLDRKGRLFAPFLVGGPLCLLLDTPVAVGPWAHSSIPFLDSSFRSAMHHKGIEILFKERKD